MEQLPDQVAGYLASLRIELQKARNPRTKRHTQADSAYYATTEIVGMMGYVPAGHEVRMALDEVFTAYQGPFTRDTMPALVKAIQAAMAEYRRIWLRALERREQDD